MVNSKFWFILVYQLYSLHFTSLSATKLMILHSLQGKMYDNKYKCACEHLHCYLLPFHTLHTKTTINNICVVLKIIYSKYSYSLKIMSRNTCSETQSDCAS